VMPYNVAMDCGVIGKVPAAAIVAAAQAGLGRYLATLPVKFETSDAEAYIAYAMETLL
jgi:hypothetical protein